MTDYPTAPGSPPLPVEPPRKKRRALKITLISLLVLANVVVFGAYFGIRRVSDQFVADVATNQDVVEVLAARPSGDEPVTFLLIGSDSRESLPDDFGEFGAFGGERADVIMLLQLRDGRAQLLSLPRDLKVEIEGHGTQKVNAAYAFGGAPLTVKTVRAFTGLDIHHTIEVDFFGFASLVDELGGVTINFPFPARDLKSELDVPAGELVLDGKTALAYARSRQYQELRDGQWTSVAASDLGRIGRQQNLVFAMLRAAQRPSIVFDVGSILSALGDHMTMDANLTADQLIDLGLAARSLNSSSIDVLTLPTVGSNEGGVSYLVASEPGASEAIDAFRAGSGSEASLQDGPIRIRVLNGNGGPGEATRWADALAQLGFDVVSVADADTFDFSETSAQAPAASNALAGQVVAALGFGDPVVGSTPDGVDVVVIIGQDALSR